MVVHASLRGQKLKLQTYLIDGGDGDQTYFSEPIHLQDAAADWFGGNVFLGEGKLLIATRGKQTGRYFIVTARGSKSIDTQLEEHVNASVVVHVVTNPTASFDGSTMDAVALGLSVLERRKRRRWFW